MWINQEIWQNLLQWNNKNEPKVKVGRPERGFYRRGIRETRAGTMLLPYRCRIYR